MKSKHIAIAGGGLVGSLLAVILARKGHRVEVFERRPDIRKMKVVQGRSINLALSDRGWRALQEAGLESEIRSIALPMTGRLMHAVSGELTYQPYGKEGQAIYSVSRGLLNQQLLACADGFEHVSLHFDHRCDELDPHTGEVTFHTPGGEVKKKFDHVFGTDGAFSAVRNRLMRMDRFNYSQEYLTHGYKELEIPPLPDGTHRMRNDCLHIWPREEFMMIALPNPDGSFTCTLFMAFEGRNCFANLVDDASVMDFFQKFFPDAIPLMPTLIEDFRENPTSSLVMVKCSPWHVEDKVLLLGDAAHAIVPFYGQGMNCGFEDCRLLTEWMEESGDDWHALFRTFSQKRKPAADAILELALRNYIEMRDKTADPVFLLQKKIEARFASRHPGMWTPLYSQVTFSHIPYNEALSNGDKQDAIMRAVMNRPDIADVWDSEEVENAILEQLRT
ncbi:MAG: FAD-dependent monooxygenase [Flavobacteriales bacterium]|nr:FAD-dependent monooxygenase [Flavobacteriales bacterium]